MGISRDSTHKRRATGGRRVPICKGRKFELGRPAAMTKLGERRVRTVRTMGGNKKFRALRLDHGNFAWASEGCTRPTRIVDVVYNASNNELVRTKTLVKNAIIQIDATPFRQWYENHYAVPLGRKKGRAVSEADKAILEKKRSNHLKRNIAKRKAMSKVDPHLDEQFGAGRLYACISSRPGQCGRISGYILEGKELEFYLKKLKSKRGH
uniref:40S ribosomal protein S8 n=1 Tax=Salpingoeca prava TaxID=2320254 RepID=A0A8E6YIQ4_9EUKA|nr:40S ribosomal protein S8 [Salpingoeca prava]